ncbi:MAG: sensor domain-containing diguanylate cyclase [Candidatus Aquicultor sp.]
MNIIIIGGGRSETSTLQTLAEAISINILGIIIESYDEESIELAAAFNIPIVRDCSELLEKTKIDLIVDLSEPDGPGAQSCDHKPAGIDSIDHSTAQLLCRLLQSESRSTYDLIDKLTREHWSLYEIGTSLSSAKDLAEVSQKIIEQATVLTNAPASSLAIYDEELDEMYFSASTGFRSGIAIQQSWKPRENGLTNYILNHEGPVTISNMDNHPEFHNPELVSEGVKSLIACALTLDEKVVGIIYVDDFKPRDFTEHDISILSLLSTYAAMAIEKAELLEETRLLSITDDLTQLYNHRYLVQQLLTEFSRAKRYQEPLSFIIIDIDHFKQYNDTHGHVQGSAVLKQLAGLLKSISRSHDIVARYGGEEFTIVCPKTNKQNAFDFAERIRHTIESTEFPDAYTQPLGGITVSIGVASFPDDSLDPLGLIDKADIALYLAKGSGRNCVCAYDEIEDAAI